MIQHTFIRACDRLEFILSRWWGALAYTLTLIASVELSWMFNDRWTYLTNALLVVLLIGNSRRSDKAMHVKLDEIDPRADHNELEKRDELEMPHG